VEEETVEDEDEWYDHEDGERNGKVENENENEDEHDWRVRRRRVRG
jgi:hypothetical protein